MTSENLSDAPPRRPIRIWDLILSVILLFVDLFVSVVGAVSFATLDPTSSATIVRAFDSASAPHLAYVFGAGVALFVLGVFTITLVFTIRLIRARHVSFWLPLVGAVAGLLVVPALAGLLLAIIT